VIPYGRQDITEEDIAAVCNVLSSDWLTQGPSVPGFEAAMARRCDAKQAVAVNSATSALHLACLALGVGHGDLGWTVPNTFVASANCLRYCGAEVDFVDIDADTLNISISALEQKLRHAKRAGRLPKVLIPVHFSGRSCDMVAIAGLAQEYGFRVIEDASHAVGAFYAGRPVGSCTYSDLAVFSFHPVKIITTGEGGMILGNDARLLHRTELLRSHGISREASEMQGVSEGGWYYQQIELGYNYRMSDIHAALGLSQLSRLDDYLNQRRLLAKRYDQLLCGLPLVRPQPDMQSAWHLYVVQLQDASRRKTVFQRLREAGIGVNVHYIPVHLQPDYQRLGHHSGTYPNAERYYAGAITLPLFGTMTEIEQDVVVHALQQALA
jgi:UDP-4-amino-4,6-dideoxy-N-acetyl-beta-L-altrosamine transaminase